MSRSELYSFETDLRRFSEQVDLELGIVVRKVVFDIFTKIVLRTPVDAGRARASWTIDQGTPKSGVELEWIEGERISRGQATDTAKQQLSKVGGPKNAAYKVWWIYNNLPYILPLEYGHSRQAPNGMVRLSLAEVEAEIAGYLR